MGKKRQISTRTESQKKKKATESRPKRQKISQPASPPPANDEQTEEGLGKLPPDEQTEPTLAESPPSTPPLQNKAETAREGENKGAADENEPILVFQCGKCKSAVGDTTSSFTADIELNTVSLSAACGIELNQELQVSKTGHDAGCTYNELLCKACKHKLGWVYASTKPELDHRRSTFTFDMRELVSYELGSCRTLQGKQPAPSLAGEVLQLHIQGGEGSGPGLGRMDELNDRVTAIGDAVLKIADIAKENQEKFSELAEKVRVLSEDVSGAQTSLGNAHSMFLIWEERFRDLRRCEQRVNKLMTERRARGQRLLAAQEGNDDDEPRENIHVVEPEQGTVAALPSLPRAPSQSRRGSHRRWR